MTWLPYIFASALTLALYDICKKHSVADNRPFPVLLITSATGFVAVLLALLFTGRLAEAVTLPVPTVCRLVFKSALVASSWSLAYFALKTLPVTVMAPVRATGPVWTALAAIALFGEIPTLRQSIGFILAFVAFFAFSLSVRREGFHLRDGVMLLALGATLLGSASALYDKHLIASLDIPPQTVLLWFLGGMSVIYACLVYATRHAHDNPFQWRWSIPAVGLLLALSDFMYFSAISEPGARISILSTLRRTSTVITFVLGGAIFRERNLLRKGLALIALLIGVMLLCMKASGAPMLSSEAERIAGGELKAKVLAHSRGIPAPTAKAQTFITRARGQTQERRLRLFSPLALWRERAYVGAWRDKKGNVLTIARVISAPPDPAAALATREDIASALDSAEAAFSFTPESREPWQAAWRAAAAENTTAAENAAAAAEKTLGDFRTLKNGRTYYVEIAFAEPVSPRDAAKLLKNAASALSSMTATVSAANASMKWWSATNELYVFHTNLDRAKGGKFIAQTMRLMGAMRRAYESHVPPSRPISRSVVRVFKTKADYAEYMGDTGKGEMAEWSCGLWDPSREELLVAAEKPEDALHTMRHEAFHQYLYYATGRGDHATWFNEGSACFFETVKYNPAKDSVSVVLDCPRARSVARRTPQAVAAAMPAVLAMSHDEFCSGDISLHYTAAWALVDFLVRAPALSPDFAIYAEVRERYLAAIAAQSLASPRGTAARLATAAAFEPLAKRDIAADFLAYWKIRRRAK